jgi:ABC-type transport system involved in multi-copper enzyme maturation permease subunit
VIALIRSEFLRLRSRRVLMVLTALGAAGILLGMTIAAVKSHPGTQHALELSGLPDLIKGISFILVVFGLVIGASSVGADWQAGSLATLLTWEPRRTRVYLARLLVVVVTVFVAAVALQTLFALLFVLVANTRGTTLFANGVGRASAGAILRIGAMASVGSVLGVSIAMLGRSSTAALGAVFVYLAVVENLLRGLIPSLTKWTFAVNAVIFVDGRPGSPSSDQVITFGQAVLMLAIYAGVVLVAGLTSFRIRDVD